MIKCRRRQATNPQKLKNSQRLFSRFLLMEAEAKAIGVEAEAIDELGVSTFLITALDNNLLSQHNKLQRYSADFPSLSSTNSDFVLTLTLIINTDLLSVPTTRIQSINHFLFLP